MTAVICGVKACEVAIVSMFDMIRMEDASEIYAVSIKLALSSR